MSGYANSAVQFYGKEQVMAAASNRKCPCWGIWQGRQFLFKNEDPDMKVSLDILESILENLQVSTATYTIKFFETEGKKIIKIKENSGDSDGSFNFKTIEEEVRQQRQLMYAGGNKEMMELLKRMDERLGALESQPMDEVEEEEETIGSVFMGLLKDPGKLEQLINTGKSLLGMQPTQGHLGNVNRLGQSSLPGEDPGQAPGGKLSQPVNEEETLTRLGNAIDMLQKNDPDIVLHLEKLAKMSEGNNGQFKKLINMLDLL